MKTFVLNGWAASERAWDFCRFRRDRVFGYVEQLDGLPEAAMREESGGAILVGWSMGGSSAMRLAMEFTGKVKGLVLVGATARMMKDDGWAGMSERRLAALEVGLKLTKGEGLFGPPGGGPSPYMLDSDENLGRGLDYLRTTDLRAGLARLRDAGTFRFPVAVLQSERDPIVRAENAERLKEFFPQAEVAIVPGCEHALPTTAPQLIDEAVGRVAAAAAKVEEGAIRAEGERR